MENQPTPPVGQPYQPQQPSGNPVPPPQGAYQQPPQGGPSPSQAVGQAMGNYVNSMNTGLLPVMGSITQAITIGLKNAASLIVASILYVLTIWIPYINVGTTIAMLSIPVELSKGRVISPAFIFKSVYRKYMGQFFIFSALMSMGMIAAMAFLIIPAIVLSYSWCIAIYLLLDKKLNAVQALSKSNEFTYGYKMKIFCIKFLFGIVFMVLYGIFFGIAAALENEVVAAIIGIICLVIFVIQLAATLGLDAVIYRELMKRTDVTL